jgi:hypothetical protein
MRYIKSPHCSWLLLRGCRQVFVKEGVLKQVGLDRGSLVAVGAGRAISLTLANMEQCWLSSGTDFEAVKPLLLGAGLQVVLFLPPGNGVLVPNKTKTKVRVAVLLWCIFMGSVVA